MPAPVVQPADRQMARESVGELEARKAVRAELDDLRTQRAELDAQISDAEYRMAYGEPASGDAFSVMVDQLGAAGELVRGDILRMGVTPYDLAWLERTGAIRRLTEAEVRLLDERPMESETRPVTPSGAVDLDQQASARVAYGIDPTLADAQLAAVEREDAREERIAKAADLTREREQEGR